MPAIPSPQLHRNRESAPTRPLHRVARIHETFGSPSGGLGTMTGWLRLERFHVIPERFCAAGVFTGELLGSAGTTIGVCSRRRAAPAPAPAIAPVVAPVASTAAPVVAPLASAVALKRRHLGARS
jgi:hypothetical protein